MSRVLPTKRLLGLGVMAAGAVVTEGLCGGVGKAVAGLLGGVCGNLFAGFLQPALGDDEPSPETLIKNHDLRLLVGLAIRDTILLSADQVPDRRALDTLADAARELWASEATAADTSYQPLDEEAVTQMFAGGDLGFAEMRALDEATWRTFIDTAASALGDDSNLEGPLRQAIAVRLHRDLPEMLRAKVKQDFDGGTAAEGRGYASLQLVMMGRILAAVEKVSERSAADLAGDGELIDQLRKLNDRLPERVEFHKTRLGGRERNILARTLDQINTLRPHLDKRLDEVLRALAAEGAASRSRDTKTHEQLVRILAVVAVLALVGVVGWMTLYRGQTEQRRQVGETDVKIREIADHLIAQSTRLEVENEDLKAELRAENEKLRGELEAALARVNKARQAGDPDAPDISRDPGQPMTLA
ncbi:MAG: hypothetical protein OER86_09215, partial [Phycisphaerae bacterium]|nr:hypothetical protein [Phycisphaerae bacterium]